MITPRLAWPKTTITSTFALLFSFTYFWNSNITSNFDQLSSFFLPSFTIYHRSYRGRAKNPIEIIIQIVSHNSLFCRLDLYFKSCFIWSNFFTNLLANIFATFTFAKFTFHKNKQKLCISCVIHLYRRYYSRLNMLRAAATQKRYEDLWTIYCNWQVQSF